MKGLKVTLECLDEAFPPEARTLSEMVSEAVAVAVARQRAGLPVRIRVDDEIVTLPDPLRGRCSEVPL